MLTHYYTLAHLATEFHHLCAGAVIENIFTQEKEQLILSTLDHGNILISCGRKDCYIYHRETFHRAKRNTREFFPELRGNIIKRVFIHDDDRIIIFQCSSGVEIWCAMFRGNANVLIVDSAGIVTQSFLKYPFGAGGDDIIGKPLELKQRKKISSTFTAKEWEHLIDNHFQFSLSAFLKIRVGIVGQIIIDEICSRSSLEHTLRLEELSPEQLRQFGISLKEVLNELEHPSPRIYRTNGRLPEFSIIPLQEQPNQTFQIFESVNEGVRSFISLQRRGERFLEYKNSILSSLKSKKNRFVRSLEEIEKQILHSSRAEEYESNGKLLLANLSALQKGMTEIQLPGFMDSECLNTILLDKKLTPVENAERYFEKAKHARRAYEELHVRKKLLNEHRTHIDLLIEELTSLETLDAFELFMKEREQELTEARVYISKEEEDDAKIPFRAFTVSGGFDVWAGKSSANNELLTMRYAKANDLWFHARGVGGSHVVLKVNSKTATVPKEAIQQAASIAAYYSKHRKAKLVPVAYCERKFVRKPKGVHEGTVTIERETVIFVEPKLPHGKEK